MTTRISGYFLDFRDFELKYLDSMAFRVIIGKKKYQLALLALLWVCSLSKFWLTPGLKETFVFSCLLRIGSKAAGEMDSIEH